MREKRVLKKESCVIKLKYKQLNSDGFNKALAVLASQNGFSNFDAVYNVAKLFKHVQEEIKIGREGYLKWIDPLIVKDEKGEPVKADPPHPLCMWEIKPDRVAEFNTTIEEFLEKEISLNIPFLKTKDLGSIKLSPAQLLELAPIFDPSVFVPEVSEY